MLKPLLLACTAALTILATVSGPARAQPKKETPAEKLPDFPKLDPKNVTEYLNKEKTILGEFAGEKGQRKLIRVGLVAEVCLREGPLELFLCKKGTKEHESIVRVDADAQFIHAALELAGAKPGTTTQFVDENGNPKWKAATGSRIKVLVHYTMGGKTFTHPAQEWIRDREKSKKDKRDVIIPYGWVFAGSKELVDPCDSKRKFYAANSGDVISISNFPYSMLEIPADISKDDAFLTYEALTEKIPPQFSKVWIVLEPVLKG